MRDKGRATLGNIRRATDSIVVVRTRTASDLKVGDMLIAIGLISNLKHFFNLYLHNLYYVGKGVF